MSGELIGTNTQIQSDSEGRFRTTVPYTAAVLQIGASEPQHYFGLQRPLDYGAKYFDLAREVRGQVVTLRLWPGSVIEGTVRTDNEPLPGARVELLLATETGLGRRWYGSARGRTQSNPQGEFRLEGLRPGEYLLVVKRDGEASMPVYYPGVDAAHSSNVIRIAPAERIKADVRIPSVPSPGRVSGAIKGEQPFSGMRVELAAIELDGEPSSTSTIVAKSDAQGRFSFGPVPLGRYRLSAWQWPDGGPNQPWVGGSFTTLLSPTRDAIKFLKPRIDGTTWFASTILDLTVEAPIVEADLRPRPAPRLNGHAVFEGNGGSASLLKDVPIVVRSADGADIGNIPLTGFDDRGDFSTVGLPPRKYTVSLFDGMGVKDWTLRAVRLGQYDLLGAPIELGETDLSGLEMIFTRQAPSELGGNVVTRDGRPASNASVIVFPRDSALWNQYLSMPAPRRVARVSTSVTGSFALQLLAGEYLVYATELYPDDWMTPRYLKTLVPFAVSADLSKGGQKLSLTLR